jgi:hypothetical protein
VVGEELTLDEERQLTSFSFYLYTLGDMSHRKYRNEIIDEGELQQELAGIVFWSGQSFFIKEYWHAVSSGSALSAEYVSYLNEHIFKE